MADDFLNGWKEIAAFFGVSKRSVQRWEKQFRLPVRRLGGETSGSVVASRAELTAWWDANSRVVSGARATPEESEADVLPQTATTPPINIPSPTDVLPEGPGFSGRRAVGFWTRRRTAAAMVLAALALVSWVVVPRPALANWRVSGGALELLDHDRRVIGFRAFEFPLLDDLYAEPWLRTKRGGVLLVDVTGDGRQELLFKAYSPDHDDHEGFYLINADGSNRWAVRPRETVSFNGVRYGPPWHPYRAAIGTLESGQPVFLLAFVHGDRSPSLLLTVDADGRTLSTYWQDGYIEDILQAEWHGRRAVFVAGTHDETGGASLAVFDSWPAGSAPAQSQARACSSCAPGGPSTFIVFPAQCIARAGHGGGAASRESATVDRVWIEDGSVLRVNVGEGSRGVEGEHAALLMYRLGAQLEVLSVDPSSGLRQAHDALFQRRLLDHPLNATNERPSWLAVSVWTMSTGWSEPTARPTAENARSRH